MVFGQKIVGVTYDILRGVNATLWGGVEGAEKAGLLAYHIDVTKMDVRDVFKALLD